MPDQEPNARDAKLIQYLNEAYGKERQLETELQAHIAMTTRAPYRKRLQQHLQETKRHAREVERRIKRLGGNAEGGPIPGAGMVQDTAETVQTVARKGVALARGPLHVVRGTGEQEKLLKNAKTEYAQEAEEIATYTTIASLADKVGDRETAKLARDILREEERMARFLERLIPQLVGAVARDEIPAALRNGGRRRRSSSRRSSSRSTSGRSSASGRGRSSSGRSKSSSTRSRSTGSSRSSSASRSRSTARRSTGARGSASSSRSRSSGSTRARSSSRSSGRGGSTRASGGSRRSTSRSRSGS